MTLREHLNDDKLGEPGTTGTWSIETDQEVRHLRIQQTGKNASAQTHYLSLSGFEIYGKVIHNTQQRCLLLKIKKENLISYLR